MGSEGMIWIQLSANHGMYNYYINQGSSLDSWQICITVCPTSTCS